MYNFLKNTFRILGRFENFVCAFGLYTTSILVFLSVVNRYWLHMNVLWLSDLPLYIYIPYTFVCIAVTTRENAHTAVSLLPETMSKKFPFMGKLFSLLLKIISMLTMFIFAFPAYRFALRAFKRAEPATLVPFVNLSWLMEMMFVSVVLCLIHMVWIIFEDAKELYEERNAKCPG